MAASPALVEEGGLVDPLVPAAPARKRLSPIVEEMAQMAPVVHAAQTAKLAGAEVVDNQDNTMSAVFPLQIWAAFSTR